MVGQPLLAVTKQKAPRPHYSVRSTWLPDRWEPHSEVQGEREGAGKHGEWGASRVGGAHTCCILGLQEPYVPSLAPRLSPASAFPPHGVVTGTRVEV